MAVAGMRMVRLLTERGLDVSGYSSFASGSSTNWVAGLFANAKRRAEYVDRATRWLIGVCFSVFLHLFDG
jgi:hypothetical protein